LTIYKKTGNTFIQLPGAIDVQPAGIVNGVAFNPDGDLLLVAHDTTPFGTLYDVSGDTFTKRGALSTGANPPGNCKSCAWRPDGVHFILGCDTTPFIAIYNMTSDSPKTFAKITNPSTPPAGTTYGCGYSWGASVDGGVWFFAAAHDTSPYISVYQNTANTYAKTGNPGTLPAGTGRAIAWAPPKPGESWGEVVFMAHDVTPFVSIYRRTAATTFTKQANPLPIPLGNGQGASSTSDGRFVAITNESRPQFLTVYEGLSDAYTGQIPLPDADAPVGSARAAAFSADGALLAVAHDNAPYVAIYERSPIGAGDILKYIYKAALQTLAK